MNTQIKKTILIVEDDAVISSSLRELLESYNYHVLTASNGSEALKVLKSETTPSLILLDLMMPVMDGFEFRQNQLAEPSMSAIPVVIMSADGHIIEKRAKTSANDYVKKPLDIYQLINTIEKLVS